MHGEADRSHIAMVAIVGTGATVAYHKMWSGGVVIAQAGPETGAIAHATLG